MATIPPTMALCRELFGAAAPVVFGWVFAAHQVGAAAMALGAWIVRDELGAGQQGRDARGGRDGGRLDLGHHAAGADPAAGGPERDAFQVRRTVHHVDPARPRPARRAALALGALTMAALQAGRPTAVVWLLVGLCVTAAAVDLAKMLRGGKRPAPNAWGWLFAKPVYAALMVLLPSTILYLDGPQSRPPARKADHGRAVGLSARLRAMLHQGRAA